MVKKMSISWYFCGFVCVLRQSTLHQFTSDCTKKFWRELKGCMGYSEWLGVENLEEKKWLEMEKKYLWHLSGVYLGSLYVVTT